MSMIRFRNSSDLPDLISPRNIKLISHCFHFETRSHLVRKPVISSSPFTGHEIGELRIIPC